jgi:hypothetical protein
MWGTDSYLEERLMEQRVREERAQATLRRLGHEAPKAHPGWASRQRCWLLCQSDRLLVSLGRRLWEAGLRQALPLEESLLPR